MSAPRLDRYRISAALSAKLRLVTLVAVTAVVFVHAYNLTSRFGSGENAAEMRGAPGAAGFVEYLISQALTRWPAAMLFAISGFLFFHNLQPYWADYRRKYAGRLRTVVVPLLLWSAISLVVYLVLQSLPWSSTYFTTDFFGEASLWRLADKLFLAPVAYPLWFLQTLIVCFAIAPLLYWPARTARWIAVAPFALLWVLGAPATDWNDWKGVTFFTLGAVIALERRRGVKLSPSPWVGRLVFPAWLLACVLYTALLRDVSAAWADGLHKGLMCLAVAAVWFGYEAYISRFETTRLVTLLLPYGFLIFAAQEPLLTILKRVGLKVLGSSPWALLAVYFGSALLTLVVVVGIGALMRRHAPAAFAWLTGGRGGPKKNAAAAGPAGEGAGAAGPAEATDLTGEPAVAEAGALSQEA
ncbi:MAG: acyltransferase [Actinobacteria bacterium]|nr:acyltransferase [Actinomycetota bacterium]